MPFPAKPGTVAMAKIFTICTSTSEYVLLSVAVCIMLATSASTVHAKTCREDVLNGTTEVYTDKEYFYRGLQYSVSCLDIGTKTVHV